MGKEIDKSTRLAPRSGGLARTPVALLLLGALLLGGCGLGMDAEERLDRAQAAFDNGDLRAAAIDARNVLLDDPDNLRGRVLLGRASVAAGDGAAAEKELRRAVELGAPMADVAYDLGRALLMQGNFDAILAEISVDMAEDERGRHDLMRVRGDAFLGAGQPEDARAYYQDILRENDTDAYAKIGVVNTFIAERNLPQAREMLDRVLTESDSHIPAWLVSGALNTQLGDPRRAATDFQRAAELAVAGGDVGNEMQALSGGANAWLALRDVEQARQQLSRMQAISADDTRTLLISARIASVDQDWPRAQQDLHEILKRVPDYRPAQLMLGVAHKESGNLAQGEMYLSAVVAAVPGNVEARRLLAETRLLLGEADAARRTLAPIVDAGEDTRTDFTALSMAAFASLSAGDFGDATELLERSVAANPDNVSVRLQLAFAKLRTGDARAAQEILDDLPATEGVNELQRDSLMVLTRAAQGDIQGALDGVRTLVAREPARVESHNLAGAVELAAGNNAAARSHFSQAAKLAPDSAIPIAYLAQIDMMDGDPAAARANYLKILSSHPDDVRSMIALARIAAMSESRDEAREWLEKAADTDPSNSLARRLLAAMHLAARDFDAAEQLAEESIEIDSDDASLYNLLGEAQFNRGDFPGAEDSFRRALELLPGEPRFRLNVAKVQAQRGNDAAALATLEAASGQILDHMQSAVLMASLKAKAGAVDEAERIGADLRRRYPDDPTPMWLQAELAVQRGDLAAAAAIYEQAMRIRRTDRLAVRAFQIRTQGNLPEPLAPLIEYLRERPLDTRIRYILAQAHQVAGQHAEAISEYRILLDAEPDNFIALNNLAWLYQEEGDARAEATARRAFEIQPDNGSVMDTLGWILVSNGKVEDGLPHLRKAVELSGNRPDIRFHLAAGLAAAGDAEDARAILTEILAAEDAFGNRSEAEQLLSTL